MNRSALAQQAEFSIESDRHLLTMKALAFGFLGIEAEGTVKLTSHTRRPSNFCAPARQIPLWSSRLGGPKRAEVAQNHSATG
jgi:hypothetical protein